MGHKKIRAEKNCLNCGNIVDDRFCPHCGQENLEIHDSAFHLAVHYIQDMFHYDGKLWHTLKILFRKPGQVAVEYMEGKRSHNLDPLRFYVFASTVFFLFLFYVFNSDHLNVANEPQNNFLKRMYNLEQERKYLENTSDTAYIDVLRKNVKAEYDSLLTIKGDSATQSFEFDVDVPYLGDSTKNGWLLKWLNKRGEEKSKELTEKHAGDRAGIINEVWNEVFHKLPQLLFLSLPFFAFFLKLLYFHSHRRKYVDHFIFSVYFYAYLFVIMSIILLINYCAIVSQNVFFLTVVASLNGVLTIYIFIYLMLAMKRFYKDRWRYLLPRYFILFFLEVFTMLILFIGIIFWAYLV